ncbi:MAG: ATP-binding protein [Hydrococcus sp. RM1_1_31]|nr:ATP-binding protein [Hydrococcus sp. RM1_1_31]
MKLTQINPLSLEKFSQLDRLGIFGKPRLGKSYLANKIANWLVQKYQVFIFHPYFPFYHRDEVPHPYRIISVNQFQNG